MSDSPGYLPYEPQLSLVPWGDGIWIVNGPEVAYSLAGVVIPCPTRMTVIKLKDGSLWLHSPVCCSPKLVAAIENLGKVSTIVAPNAYHYTFLADWMEKFPESMIFSVPNLKKKLPHIGFSSLCEQPPEIWSGEIDLHVAEIGNFTEAVFFHHLTRTLIVTDLMQNFEADRVRNAFVRTLLTLGGATGPNGRPSIEIRMATLLHRKALGMCVNHMLAWQPKGIILSHGACYRSDAVIEIERAFR